MSRTYTIHAIVLKRFNYQDADRFVTLFSAERGKVSGLAKGIRKLTSRKRASLEPGNLVKLSFVNGHKTPIITESELIYSFPTAKLNLPRITQLQQLLEIIDLLTVEEEPYPKVFELLKETLVHLGTNGHKKEVMLENIRLILQDLGFTYDKEFSEHGLRRYIEEIAEKKLRVKPFLTQMI